MPHSNKQRGSFALVVIAAGIAILWCIVLPMISDSTGMSRRVESLESRGIAPDAMFYSDHPQSFR